MLSERLFVLDGTAGAACIIGFLHKGLVMNSNANRIIVTESLCTACSSHTVHVYHQDFPELRIEGPSAEQAVDYLAGRLTADRDAVSDPPLQAAVQFAIDDIRAFLHREGAALPAREISRHSTP